MNENHCIVMDENILYSSYFTEDEIPRDGDRAPEYAHTFMVCIDSYDNGLAQGRLHNYYFEEASSFRSLDQLLFVLDEVMDKVALPQRDVHFRTKAGPTSLSHKYKHEFDDFMNEGMIDKISPYYTPETLHIPAGKLTSFYIRPLYRYHCSIQGVFQESSSTKQIMFRSALELLYLLRESIIEAAQEA